MGGLTGGRFHEPCPQDLKWNGPYMEKSTWLYSPPYRVILTKSQVVTFESVEMSIPPMFNIFASVSLQAEDHFTMEQRAGMYNLIPLFANCPSMGPWKSTVPLWLKGIIFSMVHTSKRGILFLKGSIRGLDFGFKIVFNVKEGIYSKMQFLWGRGGAYFSPLTGGPKLS